MARSARQPKKAAQKAPRRAGLLQGALQNGAVALGGMVSRNPALVGGSTAFLVTLFYVSANALWYQPFPHTGAFFATRSIESFPRLSTDEPETTINIERTDSAPAPVKGDPVVERVQAILKDLDFYSGTVDGLQGPNTHKAIEAYQRKVGLSASGEIDDPLLEQLGAKETTTSALPQPAPRNVAAIEPAAPYEAKAATPPDARIVKIQAGLKAFGNDGIQLDGVVGSRTSSAIREFQSIFGLPETGQPDEAVYVKMREIGLTN